MFDRYSDRARSLIFIAYWAASRRGASHIEPEDLLHALIREDRGEFGAIWAEAFPGTPGADDLAGSHQPLFPGDVATTLLRELNVDPGPLSTDGREPASHGDIPVSPALTKVLSFVAKAHQNDTKTIEPLDLLAGIVEDRDSRLARLLLDHGITRQKVAKAFEG